MDVSVRDVVDLDVPHVSIACNVAHCKTSLHNRTFETFTR